MCSSDLGREQQPVIASGAVDSCPVSRMLLRLRSAVAHRVDHNRHTGGPVKLRRMHVGPATSVARSPVNPFSGDGQPSRCREPCRGAAYGSERAGWIECHRSIRDNVHHHGEPDGYTRRTEIPDRSASGKSLVGRKFPCDLQNQLEFRTQPLGIDRYIKQQDGLTTRRHRATLRSL